MLAGQKELSQAPQAEEEMAALRTAVASMRTGGTIKVNLDELLYIVLYEGDSGAPEMLSLSPVSKGHHVWAGTVVVPVLAKSSGMVVEPIVAMLGGAVAVLFSTYTIFQEARYRAGLRREEICAEELKAKDAQLKAVDQEAKEYLSVIVMLRSGEPDELNRSREMAANILRGRRGYE